MTEFPRWFADSNLKNGLAGDFLDVPTSEMKIRRLDIQVRHIQAAYCNILQASGPHCVWACPPDAAHDALVLLEDCLGGADIEGLMISMMFDG